MSTREEFSLSKLFAVIYGRRKASNLIIVHSCENVFRQKSDSVAHVQVDQGLRVLVQRLQRFCRQEPAVVDVQHPQVVSGEGLEALIRQGRAA